MKNRRKKKKDSTYFYLALLTLLVVVLVGLVGYAAKTSKLPAFFSKNGTTKTQVVTESLIRPNPALKPEYKESQQKLPPITYKSILGEERVKYKIDRFKKLAVQPLEFQVFSEGGKNYTPDDFKTINGYKMHYIVVSYNLTEFQHLYPTFDKGKWKVLAYLPAPGIYYGFVDISPVKEKPVVLRTTLSVQQNLVKNTSFPVTTQDLISKVGEYKAQLTISPSRLFETNILSFVLSKGANIVKNFQPYLGNMGSLVLFRQGDLDSFFMYAQPLSSDASRGLIEFSAIFILPGRYTAFAEFKIGSSIITFPFSFDIE